jgi:FtsH-binding integral membrane protein
MFVKIDYEKKMAAKTAGLMFGVVFTNTLLSFAAKRNYQLTDLEFPLYILIFILLLAALVADFIWQEKKTS